VVGEGAGVLVREEWEHAERRGARIYAEIVGFGHSCDAVDHREAAEDGLTYSRAITTALDDAGLTAQQVGLVLVDGSAGRSSDVREARAVNRVFPEASRRPLVSCPKAAFGHTFGAAGALDLAVACLSLHHGSVPPVSGTSEVDSECRLPLVLGGPAALAPGAALVLGTGRGGINAALALVAA